MTNSCALQTLNVHFYPLLLLRKKTPAKSESCWFLPLSAPLSRSDDSSEKLAHGVILVLCMGEEERFLPTSLFSLAPALHKAAYRDSGIQGVCGKCLLLKRHPVIGCLSGMKLASSTVAKLQNRQGFADLVCNILTGHYTDTNSKICTLYCTILAAWYNA